MKSGAARYTDIPLKMVGGNHFGRYSKMSSEQTFNMMISDDWLVTFAGYKNVLTINPTGQGRDIYSSAPLNKLFVVIDNNIYQIDNNLMKTFIGQLQTFIGDVFIAENNAGQIAFSDSVNLYIYDSRAITFTTLTNAVLGFTPGYITFQNTRFITPALNTSAWRLSQPNDGFTWPNDAQHVGEIQTKPTNCVACLRFPGRGNMLLVFGNTVTEIWYDVGAQLFPYQRSQSSNIDYGCINAATIAANEDMVCWVAINEQSGLTILYTMGDAIKHISTDGIDFKLAQIKNPSNCYGMMARVDGHLLYIVSWPADNLSYMYDFNTKEFFTLTDENMDVYIAKRIAFFNDNYYFVGLRDGNLYELTTDFFAYDYGDGNIQEIPQIRIPPNIAFDDQSRFVAGYSGFPIEQGNFPYTQPATNNIPRIDLSLSKDGGVNFGSNVSKIMRPQGKRQNRLLWRRLGSANDLTQQFRFHAYDRIVCRDGITGVSQ